LYGQNTPNATSTAIGSTGYLQTGALAKAPTSGIGSDLAQLSELARRIRNSSSSILSRIEGPKPEPLKETKEAYPTSSNVRSVLGDLLGTLYATENTLLEIDSALGSL